MLPCDENTGCIVWSGPKRNGYGQFKLASGKNTIAHRWIYERLVRSIPDGYEIDHYASVVVVH